jgi:hypothetical protein
MFGFILTRHVRSAFTNKYWLECVRKIREFYPTHLVVIIDDNSDPQYLSSQTFPNCIVIKSEFPKRGELLPYYYLHKYKFFKKAVILHDSTFVQQAFDFDAVANVPLFHFDKSLHEDALMEEKLLRVLDNHEALLELHATDKFSGAFGVMSVVTPEFVHHLEDKYKIFRLMNYCNSRLHRMCLERVFGVIFKAESTGPAVFGDIFDLGVWGLTFQQYIEGRKSKKAVVKVWSGR